jgi:hypothetical protein
MGEVTTVIPQGPNRHCGKLEEHERHPNRAPGPDYDWCDGVPPIEPFVELTIRVPLKPQGVVADNHEMARRLFGRKGLGFFVENLEHPDTRLVLRIRTTDKDAVYPVIHRDTGLTAVVMPGD